MGKTAIILGATGLTGGILRKRLLADPAFSTIKLFSRSSVNLKSPKIEEYLIDLFDLENHSAQFKADVVFCCIGTTKSKTPDKDKYRKIDYGIPVTAAKLCKKNAIETFIVISALGANPKSSLFYNKVKGEMQEDVLNQNIKNTYILQPSLITGNRDENRIVESLAKIFMHLFKFLIPKKYRPISPESIAKSMHWLSNNSWKDKIIPSDKIKNIAAHA